ncbi:MAG TPA: (2Fe-2S)-binding protein [Bryobacteraceae bacterium]|nr:(2Fe-2S)-binding protein [Bryobacteraceae bacterium]
MSKHHDELDEKDPPQGSFSRRGFLRGVGVTSGALGSAIVAEEEAQAAQGTGSAMGPGAVPITLNINGKEHKLTVEPRVTLLDACRTNLDLTGAKRVCDRATCGACTMIVNGKVVYSCTMLAIDSQGRQITTIEGFTSPAKPHPVSTAFVRNDAQQCGYCTPGFVTAAKGFLDRNPNPTDAQILRGLGGNLCRCGTYVGVRKAVMEAAKGLKGGKNA